MIKVFTKNLKCKNKNINILVITYYVKFFFIAPVNIFISSLCKSLDKIVLYTKLNIVHFIKMFIL